MSDLGMVSEGAAMDANATTPPGDQTAKNGMHREGGATPSRAALSRATPNKGSGRSGKGLVSLPRVIAMLAVVLALSLLAFLLWKTLRNPLETGLHIVRLEQLDTAASAELSLNGALVDARLNLESESQNLKTSRNRFEAALRALQSGQAGVAGVSPAVDSALAAYRDQAEEKLTLVDQYADEQRRLTLLFSAMRSAAVTALNIPGVSRSPQMQADIRDLVQGVTAYALQADPVVRDQVRGMVTEIALAASELETSESRAQIDELLNTSDSLMFTRDAAQTVIEDIDEVATGPALNQLYSSYNSHFSALQNTARQYRQTLAVFAAALLLAFGVIALRLRSSFSTLDELNAELQEANTNLEGVVAERTQDLRQALDDLRMQQAQLIQSEKMASLGQMVAGVAHEINTPLGYASSNVEIVRESLKMMEEGVDAESREEFDMLLADAQYGLEQIGELVMGLKNFSRVDRSQTELFDLNEGLDTSLKICQNNLKDRVQIEKQYGDLPNIRCAPSQLNQVFLNLINNAAQAIDGPGTITLSSRQVDDHVEVSVRDTGSGMDAQTRDHIFEPFFTTKPVGEGTGLGLSIVFRIIEDHGGEISVESEPGQGTEFTVRLPIESAQQSASVVVESDPVVGA